MAKKTGGDLAAFRKTYDKSLIIPQRFREALAQLGDSWETEGDFVKRVGCSQAEFGQYKEQFANDHTVEVVMRGARKRVWAGTKKFADKLRDTIAGQ